MTWSEFHTEDTQILSAALGKIDRHSDNGPKICGPHFYVIWKELLSRYFIRQYFYFVVLRRYSVQEILRSSAFVVYARSTQGHSDCPEQQVAEWEEEVNQFHRRDGFSANIKRGLQ